MRAENRISVSVADRAIFRRFCILTISVVIRVFSIHTSQKNILYTASARVTADDKPTVRYIRRLRSATPKRKTVFISNRPDRRTHTGQRRETTRQIEVANKTPADDGVISYIKCFHYVRRRARLSRIRLVRRLLTDTDDNYIYVYIHTREKTERRLNFI